MADIDVAVVDEPLDVATIVARAGSEAAGGIGVFVETVRGSAAVAENSGKSVVRLDYEAHPTLAPEKLAEAARETAERFDVLKISAVHRTGSCPIGEPTVVIACSAAHRDQALDAARFLIDTIKTTVPIWKSEVYADGSSWVGAGP